MQVQTDGIVLRSTKFSDSDIILNVFTKKFGKIGVFAKNAKRLKSPLMSSCQVFAQSSMLLTTFDGRYRLTNADLKNSFFSISKSYQRTYLGYYFLQFVEKVSLDGQTNMKLYNLLSDALKGLQENNNIILQKIIFDLRVIQIFGYKPNIGSCTICSKSENLGNYFSSKEGGRVCMECYDRSNHNLTKLDSTSFRFMEYIYSNNCSTILSTPVSTVILNEINSLMDKYVDYHFDNLNLSTRALLFFEEDV